MGKKHLIFASFIGFFSLVLLYGRPGMVHASVVNGAVSVDDSNLVWSPYNWKFSGTSYAQTAAGGSYVKIAFTGDTLGINVDTTALDGAGYDPANIKVHAYIDGATTPISKTLADAVSNTVTFSNSLTPGNHYARIMLSATQQFNNRWTSGAPNSLRITGIQLNTSGTVNDLSTTPLAQKPRKILIYGDSITEGIGASQFENSYAAIMATDLNAEYGQVGYGKLGWGQTGWGNVTQFYDSNTPTASSWRNYYFGAARLVGNDPTQGFIDGVPDAVFVNMGTNDATFGTPTGQVRSETTAWLTEVRQAVGIRPELFVISPFGFGTPSKAAYKSALLGGVTDYLADHSDSRVLTLDLGTDGYNTLQSNSSDGTHPNDTGAALLGHDLANLANDYIILDQPLSIATINGAAFTNNNPEIGQTPVFAGKGHAGSTVTVTIGSKSCNAFVSANGDWQCAVSGLPSGNQSVAITDSLGNQLATFQAQSTAASVTPTPAPGSSSSNGSTGQSSPATLADSGPSLWLTGFITMLLMGLRCWRMTRVARG